MPGSITQTSIWNAQLDVTMLDLHLCLHLDGFCILHVRSACYFALTAQDVRW